MMGVKSITHKEKVYSYDSISTVESLYNHYRAMQFGEKEEPFGWGTVCPPLAQVEA